MTTKKEKKEDNAAKWAHEIALRARAKKVIKGLCRDLRDAEKMKLPCDECAEPATGRCSSGKHWLCDSCELCRACGCDTIRS